MPLAMAGARACGLRRLEHGEACAPILAHLTNGFSKKIENHAHAVALHFMFYNFAKIHKTLRVTPAMQAGIADHVWTLEDIAQLPD